MEHEATTKANPVVLAEQRFAGSIFIGVNHSARPVQISRTVATMIMRWKFGWRITTLAAHSARYHGPRFCKCAKKTTGRLSALLEIYAVWTTLFILTSVIAIVLNVTVVVITPLTEISFYNLSPPSFSNSEITHPKRV